MLLKPILIVAGICGSAWAVCMGVANNSYPYAQSLIEDKSWRSDYSSGYASKYSRFLSGVDVSPENDGWWHWVFFYRYRQTELQEDSGFYGKKNPNQLRIACREAYGGSFHSDTRKVSRGSVSYAENEIWKFCSPSSKGLAPKTMQEAIDDTSTLMKARDRENLNKESEWNSEAIKDAKSQLLSIHHPNNNWVWSLRQREFNKEPERTGFFSRSGNGRFVKDKCAKAYSSQSDVSKNDILKWCGM